jgi:hypothetical protein
MTRVKSLATAILYRSKWHLAPAGRTTCDYGVLATQSECASAVAALASAANRTPGRNIQVGNVGTCNEGGWGTVPLGCSAQTGGDWTAHFKTSVENCNSGSLGYQPVCYSIQRTERATLTIPVTVPGSLCDQLLQQFHRFDEELSIQGKWQGGSVTGVCRGWGTNKVRSIVHYSLGRHGRSLNEVHSYCSVPLYPVYIPPVNVSYCGHIYA